MGPSSLRRPSAELRACTWLAPGIPLELFELVAEHVGRALGRRVIVHADERTSGPMAGDEDPFASGAVDLGFVCSPSYLSLGALSDPTIALVPAGFVFADPRNGGRPTYFSEVVVRADHAARSLADLAGGVWGSNDPCSLSGHFATMQRLAELGCDGDFFARSVFTGSHARSIEAALAGEIDGAAIDSNVLTGLVRARPELREQLRVVETWGPWPIQPIVVRAALAELAEPIASALVRMPDPERAALARHGLARCVPTSDALYQEERRALVALGQIPG